jgi:uncharacterized lipoprotein YbaY
MPRTTLLVSLAALSLSLAACDRNTASTPAPKTSSATQPAATTTTGTPARQANAGSTQPPVNGQVDSTEGAQRKDFQHPESGGR